MPPQTDTLLHEQHCKESSVANPALNQKRFEAAASSIANPSTTTMTRASVARALSLLVALLFAGAALAWWHYSKLVSFSATKTTLPAGFNTQILLMSLLALGVGFAFILLPRLAPVLAPLYAVLEGAVLGAVSLLYNAVYPGIVLEALGATVSVFVVFGALYFTGIVTVTNKMRAVIMAATFGVALFYGICWISSLFTGTNILAMGGPLGIGISLVTATVASFNLFLDFDFIDRQVEANAPVEMSWYAAGGTVITLAWVYLEMLRLLSKFNRR